MDRYSIIYVNRGKSLTLACPLEAKYDLSNFNDFYLKILLRLPMLDFCPTILVYLENLIPFL